MYLALMEGDDPATTRPVLMTRDKVLLQAFADALEERIREGAEDHSVRRQALELINGEGDQDD